MLFKKGIVLTAIGTLLAIGIVSPAKARNFTPRELNALSNNLDTLCNASFDEIAEDMGITFNQTGKEYLDVACDYVLDDIDESDLNNGEFVEALEFLEDVLVDVTYE